MSQEAENSPFSLMNYIRTTSLCRVTNIFSRLYSPSKSPQSHPIWTHTYKQKRRVTGELWVATCENPWAEFSAFHAGAFPGFTAANFNWQYILITHRPKYLYPVNGFLININIHQCTTFLHRHHYVVKCHRFRAYHIISSVAEHHRLSILQFQLARQFKSHSDGIKWHFGICI